MSPPPSSTTRSSPAWPARTPPAARRRRAREPRFCERYGHEPPVAPVHGESGAEPEVDGEEHGLASVRVVPRAGGRADGTGRARPLGHGPAHYAVPVEPNPPAPRSVSSSDAAGTSRTRS